MLCPGNANDLSCCISIPVSFKLADSNAGKPMKLNAPSIKEAVYKCYFGLLTALKPMQQNLWASAKLRYYMAPWAAMWLMLMMFFLEETLRRGGAFCFFILRDIHGGRRALVPLDTGGIRPAMGLVELRIYMYLPCLNPVAR